MSDLNEILIDSYTKMSNMSDDEIEQTMMDSDIDFYLCDCADIY